MTEENNEVQVVPCNPLDQKLSGLVDNILTEEDPNKTKDLVDLFNWNMSKKNILRLQKLNNLYDSITDQMVERVDKRADQFSNSDLLDYVKTIQGAIDINTKNLTQVQDTPQIIQQQNTQINVNLVDNFDQDAKKRILDAIQATLKQASAVKDTQEEKTIVIDNMEETT